MIFPSFLFEAQGRFLSEAMAAKTLVITTNAGVPKDVLGECGEALLFEPNAKSLISKIEEVILLDSKNKKIKENLYNRFMENYREEISQERSGAL